MTEIIFKPFDWNDNLSEIAFEDFSMIQQSLSYGTATTIGMALAKLKLLEKQGCKVEPQESENKVDSGSTASRFKCRAEQGSWCKRWEKECVSWENCELSSYNFPCPGCVMSSPLEREECDNCCWKDEKQKHYQS